MQALEHLHKMVSGVSSALPALSLHALTLVLRGDIGCLGGAFSPSPYTMSPPGAEGVAAVVRFYGCIGLLLHAAH